jgi:hypothetical protein
MQPSRLRLLLPELPSERELLPVPEPLPVRVLQPEPLPVLPDVRPELRRGIPELHRVLR